MTGEGRAGQVPRAALQERIAWAMAAIEQQGIRAHGAAGAMHRAWSVIVPIRTSDGAMYLKYVRGAFPHEAPMTRALHDLAPDYVPQVVAGNDDLGCWISRDAGSEIDLRAFLRGGHLPELLTAHAALQQRAMTGTDWLDQGAKDLRTVSWAGHLDAIRAARAALDLDQVSPNVIAALNDATGPLHRLAARVDALGTPETMVHMDLRRVNVKLRRGRVRVIDWGDAGLGPAFLDPVPLYSEITTLNLPPEREAELAAAALDSWSGHGTMADLQEARMLCRIAYPMLYAHGLIHARPSWDPTLRPTYYGLLQFYLKTFVDRLAAWQG